MYAGEEAYSNGNVYMFSSVITGYTDRSIIIWAVGPANTAYTVRNGIKSLHSTTVSQGVKADSSAWTTGTYTQPVIGEDFTT